MPKRNVIGRLDTMLAFRLILRMSATGAPNIKHHRSLHKYDVFDSRIPVLIVHTGLCMPRVLCVHVNKQA